MGNTIIVSPKIPTHLLTYWMGVLVGLGIDYKLTYASPLHRALRERRREMRFGLDPDRGDLTLERVTPEGMRVLTGKGLSDTKLDVEVVEWDIN